MREVEKNIRGLIVLSVIICILCFMGSIGLKPSIMLDFALVLSAVVVVFLIKTLVAIRGNKE